MKSQVVLPIGTTQTEPSHVARIFDGLSGSYDHPSNVPFYSSLARRMAESAYRHADFGPESRCLDLACGTGISMEAAMEIFPCAEWHGVDQSLEMLRVAEAKPHLRRVEFHQASAHTLPYDGRDFDWILCNVAYHWLPKETALEIHRVLAPDGMLSMIVPLVTPAGTGEGNRWLARVLSKFSRYITPRRSQGMSIPQVRAELGDFKITRADAITVEETYPSAEALLETLITRSSISAIFGPHAGEVVSDLSEDPLLTAKDLRFDWKFAHIEARR